MIDISTIDRNERIKAVRESTTVNGIEYLEIASVDQKTINIYFIKPLPGETGGVPASPVLTLDNIRIDGGVRIKNICITSLQCSDSVMTIEVNGPGDFSRYLFKLISSPLDENPPDGFDPILSTIGFSFKIACPGEFDCKPADSPCIPGTGKADINYLAKDYRSFRRLIFDRLSTTIPGWNEKNPADMMVMLTELLAHLGDRLSYYQDAVGTEAYLGTSRSRISHRRHARLVDYHVHEGCNSRVFVHITVSEGGDLDGKTLPGGTPLFTADDDGMVVIDPETRDALPPDSSRLMFETIHDQKIYYAHNTIEIYTWSGSFTCLHKGATNVTLKNDPPLSLAAGDILLLEEIKSPVTGSAADADREKRHVVRIIEVTPAKDPLGDIPLLEVTWHTQDVLPFNLCLVSEVNIGGSTQLLTVSRACGNIVLADHGQSNTGDQILLPREVPEDEKYRPVLPCKNITYSEYYDHTLMKSYPATFVRYQDPGKCLARVRLHDGISTWRVQRDLLASDRFAHEFVVEIEEDRSPLLRFGDNIHGRKPTPGVVFTVQYRTGTGPAGNTGRETINHIITDFNDILTVRNPLPAAGGRDPETLAEVRRYAPVAFRIQKRAVTEADYAEAAGQHPEVQKAKATFRWTGSWYTVFITVDRKGGLPVSGDPVFIDEIKNLIGAYRIAGYDIKICDPVYVPLDIELLICLRPGYVAADVKQHLLQVFSNTDLPDGSRGFFHPDNFSFSDSIYVSQLYTRALSVAGVGSATILLFKRWGKKASGELEEGVLRAFDFEILRADNDPNFPENGRIAFKIHTME